MSMAALKKKFQKKQNSTFPQPPRCKRSPHRSTPGLLSDLYGPEGISEISKTRRTISLNFLNSFAYLALIW